MSHQTSPPTRNFPAFSRRVIQRMPVKQICVSCDCLSCSLLICCACTGNGPRSLRARDQAIAGHFWLCHYGPQSDKGPSINSRTPSRRRARCNCRHGVRAEQEFLPKSCVHCLVIIMICVFVRGKLINAHQCSTDRLTLTPSVSTISSILESYSSSFS